MQTASCAAVVACPPASAPPPACSRGHLHHHLARRCKVGYWLTTSTEEDGNQCQIEAPAPTAGQNTTMLDIDPRIQYLTDSGFCAEEALQMAALYHGAWLPQLHTRGVAGQKLLTGPDVAQALDNWGATLDTLRVDSVAFNGTGAEEYLAFAKQWLLQEVPVVVVAYIPGEEDECECPSLARRPAGTAGERQRVGSTRLRAPCCLDSLRAAPLPPQHTLQTGTTPRRCGASRRPPPRAATMPPMCSTSTRWWRSRPPMCRAW